ncbi:MAG: phosphoribosylglycinamide formyltransferase [Endomicrobiales bacterium]
MTTCKIGVLVSGGGSNLQAIIDACEAGVLKGLAEVAVVISNRSDAFALERAKKHGIPGFFIDRKQFKDGAAYCEKLVEVLKERRAGLVCLAGFLLKLEPNFIRAFKGRIINIHPALLPKFGGKGMYGHHVHEAVVAAKEQESGATVHWVDEEFDHGEMIIQAKVTVPATDTPDALARRVLEVEHRIYPEAIRKVIKTVLEGK